ncbi:MAG: translation initiation factor IF-2 [Deltaproteobacteria bacterium]|jgi:translation initiation factor IF-2|nr:translation initiation factor IF-2 [Deltaproteobacteria bacterium]
MSLRVFELAKELNTPTKDLIKRLSKIGFQVKGNFAVLTDSQVVKIKKDFLEPSSRIKETLVSSEDGPKKVRRRIISARKATASKKIKKSLKIEDQPFEADVQTREEMEKPVKKKAEIEKPETVTKVDSAKEEIKDTPKKGKYKKADKEKPGKKEKKVEETKIDKKVEAKKVKKHGVKETEKLQPVKVEAIKKEKELEVDTRPRTEKPSKVPQKEGISTKKEEEKKVKLKKKEIKAKQKTAVVAPLEEDSGLKKKKEKPGKHVPKKVKGFIPDDVDNGKPIPRYTSKKKQFKKFKKKGHKAAFIPAKEKHTFNPRKKELIVGELITVGDLAKLIGIRVPEIIKTLMSLDIMATITQSIDGETAALVANEHKIELKVQISSLEDSIDTDIDDEANLKLRPAVVTIMGHVDHGKTLLLDKIRSTNVLDGEAGGITQHIGAYHVDTHNGKITFLDTPGHAAFTSMRARGADVTDIVILVVAADDGPKPQTVEAIHHAKAADVSIIVAINKCDKPDANPDRVVQQLMEHELISEEFGGDIPMIKVSAKAGEGIDELLEMIHLQSEIMDLKANPSRFAQGVVIESRLDKGRGNAATILIQNGTLKVGDNYVVGTEYGRVRAMWDDRGKKVEEALPSMPVEIVGLNGLPNAGDRFNVGTDEKQVRQISVLRTDKEKEKKQAIQYKKTLENIFDSIGQEEKSMLNLIIKADVIGSAEALSESLATMGNEEVAVNVVHSAVGAISNTDVTLATASSGIIIGFNTRPDPTAKKIAKDENIEIRLYSVIYEAIEDVKKALEGMLRPIIREEYQGKATVQEVFNIPKVGLIAGSKVSEGKIIRNSPVRILRDNIVIHDGRLSSLKRFKDDAKEVSEGFECGIGIEQFKDVRVGDEIESYLRLESSAKL